MQAGRQGTEIAQTIWCVEQVFSGVLRRFAHIVNHCRGFEGPRGSCAGAGDLRVSSVESRPLVDAGQKNRSIAAAIAVAACLCSLASLMGWLFDFPQLRTFGFDTFPVRPLTSLGHLALAAGLLAVVAERPRVAVLLWLVPLAVAESYLVEALTHDVWSVARLIGDAPSAAADASAVVRPRVSSIAILFLLTLAAYGSLVRKWLSAEIAGLVATLILCLSAAAIVLVLFSEPGGATPRVLIAPMPAAICGFALSLSLIVLSIDLGWVRAIASRRGNLWMLGLLPAALLLPVIPSLLELFFLRGKGVSVAATGTLVTLCNMMIVGVIAYWSITRIAKAQATSIELSEALNAATVAITTATGRIVYWSAGCEKLYGWSAEEAQGQNKYALLRSFCPIRPTEPRPTNGVAQELVERDRNGRDIFVIEHGISVSSPGREPVIALKMTDATERRKAVEALKETEERLAVAALAQELGVFEWDVASGRIDWSPGTELRLGLYPGSMSDFDSWSAQVAPEDLQSSLDTIARAVQARAGRFGFRYRFRQPNGGVRAVEGSSRAFYDDEGNLVRTVGVILDITEREEHDSELRQREAQLRSILQAVPDAMIVTDDQGIIQQFSAAAERLWGYRSTDVVGRPATILVPEQMREPHMTVLRRFLQHGEGVIGDVHTSTAELADGRRYPIEIRTGVARVDDRFLLTMFVRDLSERLAAEERLSDLSAEIAHVSRQSAMSELAADLAHELNQPLSATSNYLSAARMLLERGEGAERVIELLRSGADQTHRAGEIIRRMRAFMARGEVEMRAESIERTVRDAADLVQVGTTHFNIRIAFQLDPEVRFVFADRIQVQQVLVNLMRNAMEALRSSDRPDRIVTIGSRKTDDQMVELAVSDNGPGIPAQVLENMFSRFTTTKGSRGGMGIGLSISKRIIEAHGGSLSAANQPGGGAIFRFTLPMIEGGHDQ
ncbi:PAS domain S-box protein [Sphingomonas sp. S2-65]|uniref:PAS domain-containing sensor histidine kinase n=1 Tax=Sphingomonas sp. S2-65 TaxID=2903960 RepID=UPI001F406C45|nr:PAS domain S-box protein [Sphingomonas sp. S2-65]UYY59650.1 PAS domain S-box protein [Sphingomonas sp. S2-65]